jgi:hypothetical protein
MDAGEEEVERLLLSPGQIFWKSCGLVAVLGVVAALALAAPIAAIATAESGVDIAIGVAVLALLVGLEVVIWVMIRQRYREVVGKMPVVEATATELSLCEAGGETQTVKRSEICSVARLSGEGISGNRILFLDAKGRRVGVWDTGWIAGTIMNWLSGLGYQTTRLREQRAIDASVRSVEGT